MRKEEGKKIEPRSPRPPPKKKEKTYKGVALDVSDPLDGDEQRPERPHGPDDEPQGRPGPSPAAAPDEERRRRRRRRSRDSQRQGGPPPGALLQQRPLVEVLPQDGDGVGHGLLGDGQGGLLGEVGLWLCCAREEEREEKRVGRPTEG